MDRNAELAALELVLTNIERAIGEGRFRAPPGVAMVRLMLLLTAVENAKAFVQLSESYPGISCARSAFEALVDFRVLGKDPGHLQRMKQLFLSEKKRAMKNVAASLRFHSPTNVEAIRIADKEVNAAHIQLEELQKAAKAAKSDLLKEHLDESGVMSVVWGLLCDVSHNNVNILALRHSEIDSSGRMKVMLHSKVDSKFTFVLCKIITAMLEDAKTFLDDLRAS